MTEKALDYINRLQEAIIVNLNNAFHTTGDARNSPYFGTAGAQRLAREIGSCLLDFNEDERKHIVQKSFTHVCVKGYNLRPPISAKDWNHQIKEGFHKAAERYNVSASIA